MGIAEGSYGNGIFHGGAPKTSDKVAILLTVWPGEGVVKLTSRPDLPHSPLLFRLLDKFNFGPTIIQSIKTIYKKMTSRLIINGLMTDTFNVTRSLRQGDGLSMALFY